MKYDHLYTHYIIIVIIFKLYNQTICKFLPSLLKTPPCQGNIHLPHYPRMRDMRDVLPLETPAEGR